MLPELNAFWRTLAAHGGQVGLSNGKRTLSYGELLLEVSQRMALLTELRAQRVALCLDNGIDWVLWDLALLFSGRVCVPVPHFFSDSQKVHVLDSSGVDTLIGGPEVLADRCGFVACRPDIAQRAVASAPALPEGTQKITYTSGTTGQPKGVCLDAGVQLAVAQSLRQATGACACDRHLCVLPLATLLENIAGIYTPLLAGARIELRGMADIGLQGASSLDLPRLLGNVFAIAPSSLILVPQLLMALVSAAERGMALPASLRFVAVGGGRVAPQLLRRADALGLPVFEGYGLSECASVVCLNTPQHRRIGAVGKPLPHLQVSLGLDGEVLVRGARMLGYLGDAALDDDWLATGDLGHFEEGFLVLHGRKKHQFITAYGRNVNPEWVEAELTQQAPIAQAWVHGEALASNLAVLVPRHAAVSDAELGAAVARVNAVLPDYARVDQWLRADQAFSPANGKATTNGRLRRAALWAHYEGRFAAIPVINPSCHSS
ncbi:AMP-binding protein [Rhodoferax sp.]|uniref:AMP-binding protein n=1 Tax=Rhodoferax sp. TaxID=50421 RepID=UPI0019E36791|nr:AMP-binding protein [Rhodoferax sp.]MBE0473623.1 AMP-binding protein [Rhodoferax sp.]